MWWLLASGEEYVNYLHDMHLAVDVSPPLHP